MRLAEVGLLGPGRQSSTFQTRLTDISSASLIVSGHFEPPIKAKAAGGVLTLSVSLSKLGFGAAQFRLGGAPVARGRSPEAEVGEIMTIAARSGLGVFDTTAGSTYADDVIGQHLPRPCRFRMMVKTGRADRLGGDHVEAAVARASLLAGLRPRPRRRHHRAVRRRPVRSARGGEELWARLLKLRDEGSCSNLSASRPSRPTIRSAWSSASNPTSSRRPPAFWISGCWSTAPWPRSRKWASRCSCAPSSCRAFSSCRPTACRGPSRARRPGSRAPGG